MKTRLVCIVVLFVLLAGCSGGQTPTTVSTQPTAVPDSPTSLPPTQTSVPPTPTPWAPSIGGKVLLASSVEPATLDPQLGTDQFVAKLIFGSVMGIDENGQYYPLLAEEVTTSEDGLTWTVKFRSDLKWHDGTPFKASDYVYTMTQAATRRGIIRNLLMGFDSVIEVDDYTVQINFKMVNAAFQYALTTAYLAPIPQAYIEKVGAEEFARKPIGLGMFKFKEWVVGNKVTLDTNREFTALPEGKVLPYIETFEIRFIQEDATRLAGLTSGEIDYTYVPAIQINQFLNNETFTVVPRKSGGFGTAVFMNTEKAPFNDINVRKALNYAVNRDQMLQVVAQGRGEVLYGPLRPATIGYSSEVEKIGYSYNLEKVTEFMTASGYAKGENGIWAKDGVEVAFTISTDPLFSRDTEVLQMFLTEAGFKCEIQQLETGALMEALAGGNYDMNVSSASWADAVVLFGFFHSSAIDASNYGRINDPVLDGMLLNTFGAPNRPALESAAAEAQKYIVENAFVIPLYVTFSDLVVNNRFTGYTTTPTGDLILYGSYIK